MQKMKKTNFYVSVVLVMTSLAACNGSGSSTGTTDSTSQTTTSPADGSVTTTTTVTHSYTGKFIPKPETRYIDLKTRKTISVHIDTIRGEIVNAETNEPIYLFVEPATHDTIYGLTGAVVNNYIIKDESGDYKVDTIRVNTAEATATSEPEHTGNYKEKIKGDKHVIKTDDYKVKVKDGEIKKIKDR
jgi:hypothetical protein